MSGADAPAGDDDGTVGGRYRLLTLLDGGPGRVWHAHDDLLGRDVAVHEIDVPAGVPSGQGLGMQLDTMQQARAAAQFDHPGAVRVLDVVWSPGRSWVVSEYVPARSLHDLVRGGGPLDHQEAARIGVQVLRTLRAAHAGGMAHRDVQPHHVLVAGDDRVVLGGFGLASFEGAVGDQAERLPGSPYFIAPERLRSAAADARADLFSLGATLHAAVEGRPPFARATVAASLAALASEPPDVPQRPGPLHAVIGALLAKDPGRRMSAEQAEEALLRIADRAVGVFTVRTEPQPATPAAAQPGAMAAAQPAAPVGGRGTARSTRVAVGVAAVLLVGTAGAALLTDVGRGTPAPGPAAASPTASPAPGAAFASPAAAPGPAACAGLTGGSPVVSATAGNPRYALPDGWVWHRDTAGFQVALPQGWTRFTDDGTVCFRDPDGARTFGVRAAPPTRQPLAYWQEQERTARAGGTLPGYRRVSLATVPLRSGGAAWEFTYTPGSGPRQQVRRLLVSVTPQRAYALQWTTRETDWGINEAYQRLIVASFG